MPMIVIVAVTVTVTVIWPFHSKTTFVYCLAGTNVRKAITYLTFDLVVTDGTVARSTSVQCVITRSVETTGKCSTDIAEASTDS
mmetsp:Transcript_2942/g.6826  ORF Transcript_2942/g.6826 Transcript_2942/m.6826 type:complete len:84 (-) Transcript_2942:47-298(-)